MLRKLLPIAILAAFIVVAYLFSQNPPQVGRSSSPARQGLSVEVLALQPQDYAVQISSYGRVQPRTQTSLIPQVSGEIVKVSANFRPGGFFNKGELLIQLDDRSYRARVQQAQAQLDEARQQLVEARAQVEQAQRDWARLGNGSEAPALVLRKPQLAAAQAGVKAAQAQLALAKIDLEHTRIRAPYAGRVLNKNADIGQVISTGAVLAEIYATDQVEVRLPLQNNALGFVDLPELRPGEQQAQRQAPVELYSQLQKGRWQGRLVRTEGAIDSDSQQLYVVAQIDDPYTRRAPDQPALKIGEYLSAQIRGRTLHNVIVVPNQAIYQSSYVYTLDEGLLQRQPVEIRWQNGRDAIISAGLKPGDKLVLTPLGQVASGTKAAQVSHTATAQEPDA